jgi:hypothetical protein
VQERRRPRRRAPSEAEEGSHAGDLPRHRGGRYSRDGPSALEEQHRPRRSPYAA